MSKSSAIIGRLSASGWVFKTPPHWLLVCCNCQLAITTSNPVFIDAYCMSGVHWSISEHLRHLLQHKWFISHYKTNSTPVQVPAARLRLPRHATAPRAVSSASAPTRRYAQRGGGQERLSSGHRGRGAAVFGVLSSHKSLFLFRVALSTSSTELGPTYIGPLCVM